jgi:hypothetical protein
MPQWFFEWSSWLYGAIGAIAVVIGWFSWKRPKTPDTTNVVKGGDDNDQAGGKGTTVNRVDNGSGNRQRG